MWRLSFWPCLPSLAVCYVHPSVDNFNIVCPFWDCLTLSSGFWALRRNGSFCIIIIIVINIIVIIIVINIILIIIVVIIVVNIIVIIISIIIVINIIVVIVIINIIMIQM